MTEEEQKAIEEMYEEGLVNVSRIAEPLINKYKELDYQQCQFVIEYLLADRQSNEEYVDKLEADIEIKDKVIDYAMEEIHSIVNLGEFIDRNIDNLDTKEEIKQYFYKQVEKVGGEDDI